MKRRLKGMTLIELMVGMVIGLMVLGAIISVYLSARHTSRTNEIVGRMQENGRFALEILSAHLMHAGYLGTTAFASSIKGRSNTPNALIYNITGAQECAAGWMTDLTNPLRIYDDTQGAPFTGTCLSAPANWTLAANSDFLEIRNANPQNLVTGNNPPALTGTIEPGRIYIMGDIVGAELFTDSNIPSPSEYTVNSVGAHELRTTLYFIANYQASTADPPLPSLMRVIDTPYGNGLSFERQQVIPGIQNMQIQVGLDTTGNLDADTWQSATAVTDFTQASAVRIWLLIRSEEIDTSFNPSSAAVEYQLGDQTLTFNDNYRRMVMTRTIRLPNINQMPL